MSVEAPAVERDLAFDMVRRSVPFIPFVVGVAAVLAGADGALSALFAVAIVLVNLTLSAVALAWAARRSPAALMGTALGGFLVRMVLVALAVWAVKDQAWAHLATIGITVLVTHLGLLAWETRFVSASLAYPGLKPTAKEAPSS